MLKKLVLLGMVVVLLFGMTACKDSAKTGSEEETISSEESGKTSEELTSDTESEGLAEESAESTTSQTNTSTSSKSIVIGTETPTVTGDPFKDFKNDGKTLVIMHHVTKEEYLVNKKKGGKDGIYDNIARFQEKYGGTVQVIAKNWNERFQAIVQMAGNPPDLVMVGQQDFPSSAVQKILQPVNKLPGFKASDWDATALSFLTYNGNQYGVAYPGKAVTTEFMLFNKSMFERYNRTTPDVLFKQGKWTFDEFAAAGNALTKDTDGDGKIDQWGYQGFNNSPSGWGHLNGVSTIREEGGKFIANLNDPKMVDTLTLLSKWWSSPSTGGFMTFDNYGTAAQDFKKGKIAMCGCAIPVGMSDKWGIVPYPVGPKNTNKALLSGIAGWGVPTGAKNATAALAFVYLMSTPLPNENAAEKEKNDFLIKYKEADKPEEYYNLYFGTNGLLKGRAAVVVNDNDFSGSGEMFYNYNNALSKGKTPAAIVAEFNPKLQAALDKSYNITK